MEDGEGYSVTHIGESRELIMEIINALPPFIRSANIAAWYKYPHILKMLLDGINNDPMSYIEQCTFEVMIHGNRTLADWMAALKGTEVDPEFNVENFGQFLSSRGNNTHRATVVAFRFRHPMRVELTTIDQMRKLLDLENIGLEHHLALAEQQPFAITKLGSVVNPNARVCFRTYVPSSVIPCFESVPTTSGTKHRLKLLRLTNERGMHWSLGLKSKGSAS